MDRPSGNFLDSFASSSYANNNGSLSFGSDWVEVGESDGKGTGDLEVDNDGGLCLSGRCMQIETVTAGDALIREMDLSGAESATLNFVYSHAGMKESHVHDVTITKEPPNYRV